MRRGEWAEAAEVSGIECVGLSFDQFLAVGVRVTH